MANRRLFAFWRHLTTGLCTGLPQNETKGGGPDVFAANYADPARLKGFLQAMTGTLYAKSPRRQLPVGWVQCLESARCQRSTGKIGYKIDPDIGPG